MFGESLLRGGTRERRRGSWKSRVTKALNVVQTMRVLIVMEIKIIVT